MRTFSNNLIFSYVLIVLGIYLLAAAGYDEFRGITRRPILLTDFHRRGTMGHAYLHRVPVRRQQNPELFRQFMMGHWIWAVGIEGVGWILCLRNR
jgi:hypothetical protein